MKDIPGFLGKLVDAYQNNDSGIVHELMKKIGILLFLIFIMTIVAKFPVDHVRYFDLIGLCCILVLLGVSILFLPTKQRNKDTSFNDTEPPINADKIRERTAELLKKADDLFAQEHYNEAGDAYRQVTKENSGCAEAWEGLGKCLEEKGHLDTARDFFGRSLQCIEDMKAYCDGNQNSSAGFMKLTANADRIKKKITEIESKR